MNIIILGFVWFTSGVILPMLISQCSHPWSASVVYYFFSILLAIGLYKSRVDLKKVWWLVPMAFVYLFVDVTEFETACLAGSERSSYVTFCNFLFTGIVMIALIKGVSTPTPPFGPPTNENKDRNR